MAQSNSLCVCINHIRIVSTQLILLLCASTYRLLLNALQLVWTPAENKLKCFYCVTKSLNHNNLLVIVYVTSCWKRVTGTWLWHEIDVDRKSVHVISFRVENERKPVLMIDNKKRINYYCALRKNQYLFFLFRLTLIILLNCKRASFFAWFFFF